MIERKNCFMKIMLICAALALSPALVLAEEDDDDSRVEELVQELFLSDIVYPQDANELQITTGVNWIKEDSEKYFTTPVEIEYGITDKFQLGVSIPVQYGGNVGVSGVGNIELESLYNFYNDKEFGWAFSGTFGLSFPSPTDEVGEEGYVFEPGLIGYKTFGVFALNLAASVEIPTESEENTEVEIGAAAIYDAGIFRPIIEIAAEFEDGESAVSVLAGANILLIDEIELGLGVAKGLNDEAPDWQVFSSLTLEFDL